MSRHSEVDKLLAGFVLAELDEQQTRQVEVHLAECQMCRDEVERLETLLAQTERASELSVDQTLCQAASGNVLLAAQNEQTTPTDADHRLRVVDFWRIIMRNGIAKLAVAALIALAVILGYNVFVDNSGSTAYAQMVGMLQKAQTMTFSVITQTGLETVQTVRTDIAIKEPGHMRISTPDGYVGVVDTANDRIEGIMLFPESHMYMILDVDNLPIDKDGGTFMSVEKLRTLPAEADELLGAAEIDGQTLEGFRVHDGDTTATVWVRPATGELARAEVEFANAPGMNTIMTDFQFDIPLDDALFSLEPPADYEQMTIQADASQVTEDDFIAYLRLWSRWTVDGTFPPIVQGTEIAKIATQMAQEGRFVGPVAPGYEADQQQQIMFNGMLFSSTLPAGSFRYAGQKVPYGDPDTPIFWYQPKGSTTYRVIYADLHVANVAPENLPQ
jgi:outer membrane lipoprotein-sorting protein